MSSTAVRVCALLLVVLMVQNSWAGRPREKPGVCPAFPAPPPPPGGIDFSPDKLGFERTGCRGDYECEGDLKCCAAGVCCHFFCTKPLDRPHWIGLCLDRLFQ
ncbi:hypothetical protein C7M84_024307 [Penaeus vannamei]|uniref:WAP domain-containing protein n=1 Tax=Penaeus vannamei TaxID=6689 RepID=A0A423U1D8_PENVA|nr:hypothetical protein C7M84_024307 [Penaeus vannamei]